MSLLTPSQSVSHKLFPQCVNHNKKPSLRHPLQTFGSFSFFQVSIGLGVDKVLYKLTKSYKSELRHLFQCCILIPRKCLRKPHFNTQCPPPKKKSYFRKSHEKSWIKKLTKVQCITTGCQGLILSNLHLKNRIR